MKCYCEGSALDPLWAALILLIAAVSLIVSFYLASAFSAANPAIFGKTFGYVQTALVMFATGIIIVYMAQNLMAVVAAWFVRAHPIFALANILITFIVLIIVNVLVNIFQDFVTFSAFSSIGNQYLGAVITLFKMLPVATLIFAVLIIIFQYSSKPAGKSL